MKKNSSNNSKTNSKKVQQVLNLKIALKLTILVQTKVPSFILNSLLFKTYIKNHLIGRALKYTEVYEVLLFNTNLKFAVSNAKFEETTTEETEECMINEESIFDVQYDNSINALAKDFENKLSINDENIIKNILENKSKYLFTPCKDEDEEINLIGYEEELTKVDKLINFSLKDEYKAIMKTEKIPNDYLYKAVMITGPSGIGKSHIIKKIYSQYKDEINFFSLNLLNDFILDNKDQENSMEEKIKITFKFAKLLPPSIIIFEDIDRLFTKPDDEEGSSNNSNVLLLNDIKTKLIFSLIKEIDNINTNDKVILISTSTSLDRIAGDLKKPGRFDYVINLQTPNSKIRKIYFKEFSKKFNNNLTEEDFDVLADKSPGFIAGDIIGVYKDALILNEGKELTRKDLEVSLKNIKPINLKDIILDIPKVLWSDIGGNKEVINKIRQSIEWPLKNPEAFKRIGITPPNGILLYGPPGCSKTMIAKALATESGLNFFAVKGPELFSKYVGDTEKAVRDIFKKAKISSPSIIFFDEVDAMASQRGSDSGVSDKVLCQLLNEMDGVEGRERVVIFGATNRPDILDKAMIRPGRFDRLIYIPPPDAEAKKEIFKINFTKMSINSDVNIDELVNLTNVMIYLNFRGFQVRKLT